MTNTIFSEGGLKWQNTSPAGAKAAEPRLTRVFWQFSPLRKNGICQLLYPTTDDICQNGSVCFKILSGYLYFSVYKQLVVAIHFTGLENELREIIGSLKMHTKRSSAAARGLVLPKK